MKKVKVIFPDGSTADIDESQVDAAMKSGAKRYTGEVSTEKSTSMVFPDGSIADIPIDKVDAAMQSGAKKKVGGNGIGTPADVSTTLTESEDLYSGKRPESFPLPIKEKPRFKFQFNLGEQQPDLTPNKIYNEASQYILKDLESHPEITKDMPYPEKFKEQVIKGDGGINIQRYVTQRLSDIEKKQDELLDIGSDLTLNKEQVDSYQKQIDDLEKEKESLKLHASEINDVQAVTQTPLPADQTKQTDYFREIGRHVNKFKDPIGVANQEKNIENGTTGSRDKELVDTENLANEQAGIEAKKKQLYIAAENGEINEEDYNKQIADIKIAESKLLSNNPGAKAVIERNAISKIIEDNRSKEKGTKEAPNRPFVKNLFNDIISYTASDDEVKKAIATAREQGYAISPDEEKKYISDKGQIPGTSAIGNLLNSSIVSLGTAINNRNPFLSEQEIEGEKYRTERLFQPTQRQTEGVLGYVNQASNVVGTVLKWATVGKVLGAGAGAVAGRIVGAETVGGISETLGGVRKLSEAQTQIAGTALTAGLLVYPDAKEEAKKFTTDEAEQDAYAGTMTLLNTLAFTALNPGGIINKILGNSTAKANFTKEFLKVVDDAGGIQKLAPETFKTTLVNFGKAALGANVSATTTISLLNVAEQATDVMYGKKPEIDMSEVVKTMGDSFISFAPISLLQGRGVSLADKNKRNVAIQLINEKAKDPVAFKDYMDNAVDEGSIGRLEADKKIQIVNTHAVLRASKDLPEYLSEENKAIYADNLRREIEIKQSIKDLTDETMLPAKEEEIKQLQEERKNILSQPKQVENVKVEETQKTEILAEETIPSIEKLKAVKLEGVEHKYKPIVVDDPVFGERKMSAQKAKMEYEKRHDLLTQLVKCLT